MFCCNRRKKKDGSLGGGARGNRLLSSTCLPQGEGESQCSAAGRVVCCVRTEGGREGKGIGKGRREGGELPSLLPQGRDNRGGSGKGGHILAARENSPFVTTLFH